MYNFYNEATNERATISTYAELEAWAERMDWDDLVVEDAVGCGWYYLDIASCLLLS